MELALVAALQALLNPQMVSRPPEDRGDVAGRRWDLQALPNTFGQQHGVRDRLTGAYYQPGSNLSLMGVPDDATRARILDAYRRRLVSASADPSLAEQTPFDMQVRSYGQQLAGYGE